MFRNQYDNDVTVWSPQGRIHQIEYAMEAVKQGSATVALKNGKYAVVVALKRAPSELSAHQKKLMKIDDHCGISIAGLTADARLLSRYLRTECLDHKYAYDTPMPVNRLVNALASKLQVPTQRYGRRPYGVGLLVIGYDAHGAHIYQTCPSANVYACKSMAIGARSQSARTYLEKHATEYSADALTVDDLVRHALRALRDTLPSEVTLNVRNCSVAFVGEHLPFTVHDEDEYVAAQLRAIEHEERAPAPPDDAAAADMDVQPAAHPADAPPPGPDDEAPPAGMEQ
jgi:20S proteasome subunit alpha 6